MSEVIMQLLETRLLVGWRLFLQEGNGQPPILIPG
jgi:hypothetical protein